MKIHFTQLEATPTILKSLDEVLVMHARLSRVSVTLKTMEKFIKEGFQNGERKLKELNYKGFKI